MAVIVPKDANDSLDLTNKKLDAFIGESKKHQLRIIDILTTISSEVKYSEQSNISSNDKSIIQNKNKEDKILGGTNAWVPPTGEETVVAKETSSNKGVLSKIWNKLEAKEAFNAKDYSGKKIPFMGALLNGLIAGLSKSSFMQSPYAKFIKFIFTPAGLMLIYFLGKLAKKYIWDPFLGPVVRWVKNVLWPTIQPALIWLKETLWPFIKSMLPTMTEIKDAFRQVWDVFTNPSSFIEKLAGVANLLDTLFAPITNLIKMGQVTILTNLAKIMDFMPGGKSAATALMSEAGVVVGRMHGTMKGDQLKKLQGSDMGKKFSAAVNPEIAEKLNAKVKAGFKNFTKTEEAILKSKEYKQKYGDKALSSEEINQREFKQQYEMAVAKNPSMSKIDVAQFTRKVYERKGLGVSADILREIRSKKVLDEQGIQEYMKEILDNNNELSRSAEGQQAVLDELKAMIVKADIKSDVLTTKIGNAEKHIKRTTVINNTMVNNTLPPALRTELQLRTNQ
jgi:hypothetical protein